MNLNLHVNRYREAREGYNEAHKISQQAHQKWKDTERDFIDAMLNERVKTFKHLETGEVFGLSERFGVSVTENNNDQIRNWLVDEAGDDAPFISEVCNKQAVTDYVKTRVEKNRQEDKGDEDGIPEFLNLKTRPVLSHRNKNG